MCKTNDQLQNAMRHVDFGGPTWSKLNVAKIQLVKRSHVSLTRQKLVIISFLKLNE